MLLSDYGYIVLLLLYCILIIILLLRGPNKNTMTWAYEGKEDHKSYVVLGGLPEYMYIFFKHIL